MIKLFRQIRYKLMDQNKTTKYLKYAIGETILVVIGILIALQINNWNEARKIGIQEQNYLKSLKDEFRYNKEQLDRVMAQNKSYGDAAFEILKHTGPNPTTISEGEFSKLFLTMVNGEVQYRPSNGVLDEIINSGKLDIFKNQELKKHLSSWSGVLYKIRFQETELSKFRIHLIDLGQKYTNTKNLFKAYNTFLDVAPTKFSTSNLTILSNQEFENQTMAFFTTSCYANVNYYSDLESIINDILQLIDSEIR